MFHCTGLAVWCPDDCVHVKSPPPLFAFPTARFLFTLELSRLPFLSSALVGFVLGPGRLAPSLVAVVWVPLGPLVPLCQRRCAAAFIHGLPRVHRAGVSGCAGAAWFDP